MEEALAGVQDIRRIVDDVVVFDRDRELHILHVREILRRCEEKGISLNREYVYIAVSHRYYYIDYIHYYRAITNTIP